MATTKEEIPFTIELATIDDIPAMAKIGKDSFLNDTHTNLKIFGLPPKVDDSGEGMLQWFSFPHVKVLKAVTTTADKTLMGSICWASRGYFPRAAQPEKTSGRFSEVSDEAKPRTKVQELEDLESGHFVQFMTDIMPPGTKCWFISGCSVDPQYQGMGVGKALMAYGTEMAENDGVFAWVHSSDSAYRAYKACGFEVARQLVVDLDDYAEGGAIAQGPGEGGKWGIYTFRYMVYKPERALGLIGK
jgi:GNAT superfamily N-acetyltransferase